jgi:hypothetical protein
MCIGVLSPGGKAWLNRDTAHSLRLVPSQEQAVTIPPLSSSSSMTFIGTTLLYVKCIVVMHKVL